MSRSARLAGRVARQVGIPVVDLPVFLCPRILRFSTSQTYEPRPNRFQASQRRYITSVTSTPVAASPKTLAPLLEKLPQQCPGCGALSQTADQNAPGFYTPTRKSIRKYLEEGCSLRKSAEDEIVKAALENAASVDTGIKMEDTSVPIIVKDKAIPLCDRCHKLKNHETGASIHHPSIQSIQDTIFESPFKYNHVYHVIDAADFPMSLVPGLHKLLHLTPQRSLNRRSKTGRFYHGKKTEVSFIITRSDLLAPLKTQVDSMMPYLQSVLRDALGRTGKDVRLGNIRCVSARQAWWTKELKEEIWQRGGGGWMVGKVNVGKSRLFHDIFPKGRSEKTKSLDKKRSMQITINLEAKVEEDQKTSWTPIETSSAITKQIEVAEELGEAKLVTSSQAYEEEHELSDSLDTSSLLPPAPPETDYPAMPLVSSLPGTTASPIRLSFGSGKGELIDLPGLSRGDLEHYVKPQFRPCLVMKTRIVPEQQVIKPGQSILLGGFIRITPKTPDVMVMAYAFVPIYSHLTGTEKAIGTQMHVRESSVENISLPETADKIASAGTFHLKWDVTRERTGPITAREAVNISPERLPYRVLAADILIEGCGWVELVAQVPKKPGEMAHIEERRDERRDENESWDSEPRDEVEKIDPSWPAVEVFSPEGRFIASRRPMNAWLNIASKPTKGKLQGRPRKSMKGAKKAEKLKRVEA
ncbi:hypothetical protein N431DRAFT_542972 [Stipitochalara longipes BDJ]|nr:hypothetical protein N431DRAFT_542972 [Stipitochalara longipes BDJ]